MGIMLYSVLWVMRGLYHFSIHFKVLGSACAFGGGGEGCFVGSTHGEISAAPDVAAA